MAEADDEEDDDDEEGEDTGGQGPSAYPLPSSSVALGSRATVPSLPATTDGEDDMAMDMEMGTINLAQAPLSQETSVSTRSSMSPDTHAQSP